MRVAIVGAGLAGLCLAHRLAEHATVAIYEKSRGPGGRIATRYSDPYRFDHGAQFFTARNAMFRDFLAPLAAAGVVAPWQTRFVELDGSKVTQSRDWDETMPHYVAVPGMNALGKHLARGLDIRLGTTVEAIVGHDNNWQVVTSDAGRQHYDWIISTAPAAQSTALMPFEFAHRAELDDKKMRGCYALMLGFESPLALDFGAALVRGADISWISVNSSKPGRDPAFTLVVHSTNAYADAHIEDDIDDVRLHLLGEFARVTGKDPGNAAHVRLHRWRYANIDRQSGPDAFVDHDNRLAACGDWCIRGRIECAWLSAMAAADAMTA